MKDYLVAVDALTVPVPGNGGRFRLARRGAMVSVSSEFAAPHVRRGALVDPDAVPVESEPDKADEDELEATDPVESEPAMADDDADKPAKAAGVEAWRKYAESKGIATKGLSKQELIAATR